MFAPPALFGISPQFCSWYHIQLRVFTFPVLDNVDQGLISSKISGEKSETTFSMLLTPESTRTFQLAHVPQS